MVVEVSPLHRYPKLFVQGAECYTPSFQMIVVDGNIRILNANVSTPVEQDAQQIQIHDSNTQLGIRDKRSASC
jgi:hypothetical protein